MTKKTLRTAAAIVAAVCAFASAQNSGLPQMRITTRNNATPGTGRTSTCSGSNQCGSTASGGGVFSYVQMTDFELTVPGNTLMNVKRTSKPDSVRRRGNSTSSQTKMPLRIKFDEGVSLFGLKSARSWVLLANYYDQTLLLNDIAFKLGRDIGLPYTNNSHHVELYLNGTYKGIYQLTEQIQVNGGRVEIDRDKGWLAELDYHQPDNTECNSWFHISSYCLGVFIKSPEDLPRASDYQFVKDDINALVNAMRGSGNGWRDLLDFDTYAKYLLVQQFMDNFDFNSKVEGQGMGQGGFNQFGLPGSNFMYKDEHHKRIYAGPLWDLDLAVGVPAPATCGGFMQPACPPGTNTSCQWPSHFCETNAPMRPRNDFYRKMWDDQAFQGVVKKVWDANKSKFESILPYIDQKAATIRGRAQANFTNSVYGSCAMAGMCPAMPNSESAYMTEIGKLKTWWSARMIFVNQELNSFNANNAITQPVETKPDLPSSYTLTVNAGTGGTVNPSGASERNAGSSVTVTATANANDGYSFVNWTVTSGSVGSANLSSASITFNISSNVTLTANFRHKDDADPNPTCSGNNCVAIMVSASPSNGGTVWPSGSASYTSGATATLKAVPAEGYRFVNWTVAAGQSLPGTFAPNAQSADATFTVNSARAFTANFQQSSISVLEVKRLSNGRNIMAVKNGLSLSVNSGADIRVVNLRGREVRKAGLTRGNHTVPLGDLPKGMYMISAIVDGREFTLRVPVK